MKPHEELRDMVSELKLRLTDRPGKTVGYYGESLAGKKISSATFTPPPPLPTEGKGRPTVKNPLPKATALPAATPGDQLLPPSPLPPRERLATLQALRDHIGDCQLCPLGASRQKLVFGVGNPEAHVVFIGEGPGFMEDRQGEPFVGPAGQLLDKILAAIELSRQAVQPAWKWVYIANMVKCHPMVDPSQPDKRNNDRPPKEEEMAKCRPFLMEQLRLIRPKFLVTLGNTATRALLCTEATISTLRGRWVDFHLEGDPVFTARLLPTYHPAALLRNPNLKKDVWEDMKLLRHELEACQRS